MVTAYVMVRPEAAVVARRCAAEPDREEEEEEEEELAAAFDEDALLLLLALSAACVRRLALACADPMLLAAPVVFACVWGVRGGAGAGRGRGGGEGGGWGRGGRETRAQRKVALEREKSWGGMILYVWVSGCRPTTLLRSGDTQRPRSTVNLAFQVVEPTIPTNQVTRKKLESLRLRLRISG